jgi:hypothetical protein
MYVVLQVSMNVSPVYISYGPMSEQEAAVLEFEAKRRQEESDPEHRVWSWNTKDKPASDYIIHSKEELVEELKAEQKENETKSNRLKDVLKTLNLRGYCVF